MFIECFRTFFKNWFNLKDVWYYDTNIFISVLNGIILDQILLLWYINT